MDGCKKKPPQGKKTHNRQNAKKQSRYFYNPWLPEKSPKNGHLPNLVTRNLAWLFWVFQASIKKGDLGLWGILCYFSAGGSGGTGGNGGQGGSFNGGGNGGGQGGTFNDGGNGGGQGGTFNDGGHEGGQLNDGGHGGEGGEFNNGGDGGEGGEFNSSATGFRHPYVQSVFVTFVLVYIMV